MVSPGCMAPEWPDNAESRSHGLPRVPLLDDAPVVATYHETAARAGRALTSPQSGSTTRLTSTTFLTGDCWATLMSYLLGGSALRVKTERTNHLTCWHGFVQVP